ncbi:winged helix-turn-helix domain-containing protein [Streptomyces sp. NBC_01142]|uniref:winged helix-turn-helix domain-containing protein n=1 Tax=Streptomyces sp. NBC_01142 TaxID=2975865 RepID=UPI00225555B5|nr:winged helix-turn-helix domain-containing protein [Streptomyces sp. NBC_01142]MCX4824056.1 winged helix-turn-helix domain-containing protein [Streptomyces sp. NBC_01142]
MATREPAGEDGRKYEIVAARLREGIGSGEYGAGKLLPPQRELRETFEVSRATVTKALDLLKDEGLIESRQGSGARVLPAGGRPAGAVPPAGPATARPALETLQPHLQAAFEADDITMDVFSLTSETMNRQLGAQITRIHDGRIRPRSISLRLMLPDPDIKLAFPVSLHDPGDERPRLRHRDTLISCSKSLRHELRTLKRQRLVPAVSVQIRTVRLTPTSKMYLLNNDLLLEGYYTLEETDPDPVEGEEQEGTTLNSLGLGATLFPYSKPDQALKVETAQSFFDSYWDLLARDTDFGD